MNRKDDGVTTDVYQMNQMSLQQDDSTSNHM